MNYRLWFIGLAMVVLWATLLFGFSAPPTAHAAPLAGTFTVNTAADSIASDSFLSLREAMLIALGGTGASGLNRALSASEKTQLSGCAINGSNFITGGCGTGITDTIQFNLPINSVINLSVFLGGLPSLNDSAGTIINGIGVFPIIDGSALSLTNVFYVISNNNTIRSLTVRNAPISAITNVGSHNIFFDLTLISSGSYGISLSGAYNTVDTSLIGINSDTEWDCLTLPSGNASHGIYIPNSITAHDNTVQYSHIGCNGGNGIEVATSVTAGNHTFGPGNIIGGNGYSNGLGNWGYGIHLGTDSNVVQGSWFYANNTGGLGISASSNNVYGTVFDSNQNGIILYGGATNNRIGCTADCLFSGSIIGNIMIRNWDAGLIITGTSALNNYVFGNRIGIDGGNHSAYNATQGLLIYGAGNNYIGAEIAPIYLNWIDYHANASNIKLDGGAFGNSIVNNQIAYSTHHGIEIVGGSHDNTIGGATSAYNNTVFSNSLDGIYITGYNNTVNSNSIYANTNGVRLSGNANGNAVGSASTTRNSIYSNTNDGIVIDGTAHGNTIGSNFVGTDAAFNTLGNLGNGLTISGNAYNNTIGTLTAGNYFDYNSMNGAALAGAGVYGNVFNSNRFEVNFQNGILLTSGTHDNIFHQGGNRNILVGSQLNGILISLAAHDNTIDYNEIIHSAHNGIELTDSGTNNNVITGTVIYSSTMDAINERNSAGYNSWSHLSDYANGGLGIDKFAVSDTSNFMQLPPIQITSATKNGGTVTVSGTASPSIFNGNVVRVELYSMTINPAGFAEGKTYLGSVTTDLGTGLWSISYPASTPGCYVAFQTVTDTLSRTTSTEYSLNTCRVMLPLITR